MLFSILFVCFKKKQYLCAQIHNVYVLNFVCGYAFSSVRCSAFRSKGVAKASPFFISHTHFVQSTMQGVRAVTRVLLGITAQTLRMSNENVAALLGGVYRMNGIIYHRHSSALYNACNYYILAL